MQQCKLTTFIRSELLRLTSDFLISLPLPRPATSSSTERRRGPLGQLPSVGERRRTMEGPKRSGFASAGMRFALRARARTFRRLFVVSERHVGASVVWTRTSPGVDSTPTEDVSRCRLDQPLQRGTVSTRSIASVCPTLRWRLSGPRPSGPKGWRSGPLMCRNRLPRPFSGAFRQQRFGGTAARLVRPPSHRETTIPT
jgi:hypothetical protein